MVRSPSGSICLGIAAPSRVPRPAAARMADTNMAGLYVHRRFGIGIEASVLAPAEAPAGGCGQCGAQKGQRRWFRNRRRLDSRHADAQIVHCPRLVVEALIALAEDEELDGGRRAGMAEIGESRIRAKVVRAVGIEAARTVEAEVLMSRKLHAGRWNVALNLRRQRIRKRLAEERGAVEDDLEEIACWKRACAVERVDRREKEFQRDRVVKRQAGELEGDGVARRAPQE